MKILQVSTQVYPLPPSGYGGLEMVVFDLSRSLGEMGHDVYILCPDGSKEEHFKILTPVKGGFHNPEAEAYEAVKPSLRDYDLIHSHGWGGHVYLAKRENPKLKVVQTLHGPMPFLTRPVEKPCFIAASYAHANFLKKELSFDCRVVHHGIDLSKYPFHKDKEDFLFFCSRVSDEKGALEFVDLCKTVGMKGILAGEDHLVMDPGAYVRRVMSACQDTSGLVRYLGRLTHEPKTELLQRAACVVSPLKPPYIEIFGLILVEAMASGTPVLVTDRGAPRELVVHGLTGAVAANTDCLAENLQLALKCKPEDCRAQAELFPREKMAKDYEAIYQQLVNGGEEW